LTSMPIKEKHTAAVWWILAFLLLLVCPYHLLIAEYNTYKTPAKIIISVYMITFPYFFTRMAVKRYLKIVSPVIILMTSFQLFHIHEYKAFLMAGGYAAIFETYHFEALEFLLDRKEAVGKVLLYWMLLFFVMMKIDPYRKINGGKKKWIMNVINPVLTVLLLYGAMVTDKIPALFPLNQGYYIGQFFYERQIRRNLINQSKHFTFGAERSYIPDEKEVYVLVIGESLRRHNLPQYGYVRNTSPLLDSMRNIIYYQDAISPASLTSTSIKLMLTPMTVNGYDNKQYMRSILTPVNEIGFQTYWISNQGKYGYQTTESSVLASEANHEIYTNTDYRNVSLDEKVLPFLDRILNKHEKKIFIVLHMMGSHNRYRTRYPSKKFDHFKQHRGILKTPRLKNLNDKTISFINEYDNSVLYTDYILWRIISEVKRQNSLSWVIFFSDHGENLYDTEQELRGHGFANPTHYEFDVPLLMWYSDKYQRMYGERIEEIRNNSSTQCSLESMFHSLCDLLDIILKLSDPQLSIFSPKFRSQERYCLTSNYSIVTYKSLLENSEK